MKLRRFLKRRWLTIVAVLFVVCTVGGYFAAKRYLKPVVKNWRIEQFNASAQEFLDQGDAENALVLVRKSIQSVRDNVVAWRIGAKAAAQLDRPEALYYLDNLARVDPSKETYLEYLRLAVHFKQDAIAVQVIPLAAKVAANEPEFYEIAAAVYRRQNRPITAKYYLLALTTLRPTDAKAALDLAEIEMGEDPQRKDVALRARVRAMADNPQLRARALTLLLRESVNAKLLVETKELMSRLQRVPDLTIDQRLLVLEAGELVDNDNTPARLAELKTSVAEDPQQTARVIQLMGSRGWSRDVQEWYPTLPEATRKTDGVKRVYAESLFALAEWARLRTFLLEGSWNDLEYLRRAYLAYLFRMERRNTEFDEAWKGALVEASSSIQRCLDLYGRAEAWRWQREGYDVMWRLFALAPDNARVREGLLEWERRQGNTTNLNRLFARVSETEPKNVVAKNNYAYTSLLLDANTTRAGIMAKQLVTEQPENPFFITTHALALLKQGNAEEALERMQSLRPSALAVPQRGALYALLLARNGKISEASAELERLVRNELLPEEIKFVADTEALIARDARSQDTRSQLAAIQQTQGEGAREAGWLAIVGGDVASAATADMQVADSLYAAGDTAALTQRLRSGHWGGHDYLRYALLAYTRHKATGAVGRDEWRQAVLLAQRDQTQLSQLLAFAERWEWSGERIEVLNQLHANSPTDPDRLAQLVGHYREARRTADLVRVLKPVADRENPTTDVIPYLYYTLLTNVEMSQSTVRAKNVYDTNPNDSDRRLVYAFSLWRQKRPEEARVILQGLSSDGSGVVPAALVRAAVEADLGDIAAAQKSLSQFNETAALPEEAEIARRLLSTFSAK